MKAMVVEHLGESGSLREIPTPQPGPGEMLVRVVAAGVNPVDWKRRERAESKFPFVVGQDFAGVVSRPAEHSGRYREGERVFGIARDHGSYAEYTVVSEAELAPIAKIPDDVGDADAAALPTAALTALAGLDALKVANGTTLLVLGATGGVGGFAVQMAKGRGAHVIGTAGSANEDLARSLGVDEFVAYDRQDVVATIKAAHPDGIDAALDLVDDASALKRTATVLRDGGAIVSTIGSADEGVSAGGAITAQNLSVADSAAWSHAGLRTLLRMLEEGTIRVTIAGERPLSDAAGALEESKRGTVDGKLVITVA